MKKVLKIIDIVGDIYIINLDNVCSIHVDDDTVSIHYMDGRLDKISSVTEESLEKLLKI